MRNILPEHMINVALNAIENNKRQSREYMRRVPTYAIVAHEDGKPITTISDSLSEDTATVFVKIVPGGYFAAVEIILDGDDLRSGSISLLADVMVTFRIQSEKWQPDEITQHLAIQPTSSTIKESKTNRLGRRFPAKHKWRLQPHRDDAASAIDKLRWLLAILQPASDKLHEIMKDATAELDVAYLEPVNCDERLTLPPAMLKQIAELGCELEVSVALPERGEVFQ